MKTSDIRKQFLEYFRAKGHTVIPSSPVLPHDDPSLLFINAGMNQFKDIFLGQSRRDYTRASSSQKCIRVGGKHNDLENVGHTLRHLTFFEMLGNFSFGDYFKKEAIEFAWEVSTNIFGFDPDKLWPSVYHDDEEAFQIWKNYVPEERIARFGDKDNFWSMGDTGPCGPCSELYYDRGDQFGSEKTLQENADGERFLEFWNLVFMQYNRAVDGSLSPLPRPSIDTGAGLERVMSLIMNVESVYETDILRSIITEIEKISGLSYDHENSTLAPAFRVISDHLRTLAFAISDGVQPSNIDRGYVLRKVLRRAVRYGKSLGFDAPFLSSILPSLLDQMGDDYPELLKSRQRISEILTVEEEAFFRTLRRGGNLLNQVLEKAVKANQQISGEDAFKLKDTYGLPIDEILLLAKDAELSVDTIRFAELEEEAKERSRKSVRVHKQVADLSLYDNYLKQNNESEFIGYKTTEGNGRVTALIVNGAFVKKITEGQDALVLLDLTPYYAEKGGQIGDIGTLKTDTMRFLVTDCQSPFKGVIVHIGKLSKGTLKVGDSVMAVVDAERRKRIARNHTATHLLHWALCQVLGEHVKQAGSVVDEQRTRFDFSHHKQVTKEEIRNIEDLVNDAIRQNLPVEDYTIPYQEAQKKEDIKQFFGEKYDQNVRVIDIDFSKELCGGTHTCRTGDIGYFRIAKEGSIAAGVRRIEAVTGADAESLARESEDTLGQVSEIVKTTPQKLTPRLKQLIAEQEELTKKIKEYKDQELETLIRDLSLKIEKVNGIPLLSVSLMLPPQEIRKCLEGLLKLHSSLIILIGSSFEDKCYLFAAVTPDWINKGIKAGDMIQKFAPLIDGKGGGKAALAQAGGSNPDGILTAITQVKEYLVTLAS